MSYSIYYQRRFIQVGSLFIPMVQVGSNNCFEITWRGQQIPEKDWQVMNYTKRNKLLFTEDEINEIAIACAEGEPAKARDNWFEKEEFIRWFNNGIKSAKPLEFYTQLGNRFYLIESLGYPKFERHNVSTNQELMDKLEQLKDADVQMEFDRRDLILPKRQFTEKPKPQKEVDFFFVLEKKGNYFVKLLKYGYKYTSFETSNYVKRFATRTEAEKYLDKYASRLKGFEVKQLNQKVLLPSR